MVCKSKKQERNNFLKHTSLTTIFWVCWVEGMKSLLESLLALRVNILRLTRWRRLSRSSGRRRVSRLLSESSALLLADQFCMVMAVVWVCLCYPRTSDACRRDATPFIAQQHAHICCAPSPLLLLQQGHLTRHMRCAERCAHNSGAAFTYMSNHKSSFD